MDVAVNRLWVHVSSFGDGNLFAAYPRILAEMMASVQGYAQGPPEFDLLLPSDKEWQMKIYFRLVAKQRELEGMPQASSFLDRPRSAGIWDTTIPIHIAKRLRRSTLGSASIASRDSVRSSVTPVTWTVSDIVKAAKLLTKPPLPVDFDDEQEMRRVYTLIYDVFRYRNILNQALTDISFFYLFPELRSTLQVVWLLLFDLYHRRFVEREIADGSAEAADKLFPTCGLNIPEAALWATRVRVAAAMSRLRIANSARKLSDMLPPHLRDEKVIKSLQLANVTCWVNKNKIGNKSPEHIFSDIKTTLNLETKSDVKEFKESDSFNWDSLCPMFLQFHNSKRKEIAQSNFVQDDILIMQNRSFSFGPAVFCKLLFKHNLSGMVIQTHISSPRSTAYLATLLGENDQITQFACFDAGDRKEEYDNYFKQLNIQNISVHSEKFCEINTESDILDQVIAIYACPPNSYSAVNDPIDLVCSRGGDLSMLEVLTDTSNSSEGQKRVAGMLEEQRLTLRFAMSRPQIQFILYETHSQLDAENNDMVKQVLHEVNRAAQYKHAELLGKIVVKNESTDTLDTDTSDIISEINNNELQSKTSMDESTRISNDIKVDDSKEEIEAEDNNEDDNIEERDEDIYKDIEVPPTDIFEHHSVYDICFDSNSSINFESDGCYLGLIERKEITRLNAKYMIKMAEQRGLFGANNTETPQKRTKTAARQKKKDSPNITATPHKRKRHVFEVDRIAAHTHASLMRCTHTQQQHKHECGDKAVHCPCPRYHSQENGPKTSPARLWWAETARYLKRLKRSLIRQKLITNKPAILRALQQHDDRRKNEIQNIDEVLSRIENQRGPLNIPVFPKLRLSRCPIRVIEKDPYPTNINSVELSD